MYHIKYLKYKNKYLQLKQQLGKGLSDDEMNKLNSFNFCKIFHRNHVNSCWMIIILMITFMNNDTYKRLLTINFDNFISEYNRIIMNHQNSLPYFFFIDNVINKKIKLFVIEFLQALQERVMNKISELNSPPFPSRSVSYGLKNPQNETINTTEKNLLLIIKKILFNKCNNEDMSLFEDLESNESCKFKFKTDKEDIYCGGNNYQSIIVFNILNIFLFNKVYNFNIINIENKIYDSIDIINEKIDNIIGCSLSTNNHVIGFYICNGERMFCNDNIIIKFNWKSYFSKVCELKNNANILNITLYYTDYSPVISYFDKEDKKYYIYNNFSSIEPIRIQTVRYVHSVNDNFIIKSIIYFENINEENKNEYCPNIFILKLENILELKLDNINDIILNDTFFMDNKNLSIKYNEKDILMYVIDYQLVKIIENILSKIDISNYKQIDYCNIYGNNILLLAIINDFDINIINKILSNTNLNINYQNKFKANFTSLMFASKKGDPAIVELLLKKEGININLQNKSNLTALMIASYEGHTAIVELLLKKEGININLQNNFNSTALILASNKGHTAIVKLLLEKEGIGINLQNNSNLSALMIASEKGYIEIVKLLLEKEGININLQNNFNSTALTLASEKGYTEISELIKRKLKQERKRKREPTQYQKWKK